MSDISVVTGVSGYSGKYITRRLLNIGHRVINLTGHPDRPTEFGDSVPAISYSFDNPAELTKNLEGATTLYNTYWIRFEKGGATFDRAVANSKTLIKAAEDAGVRRIVHISIANPSEESDLPYYRGKAIVEKAIKSSKLSYAILRPTVLFGKEGILINNIAWFLRNLPVFAVPGSGEYKLQPIFVEDFADMAVEQGRYEDNIVLDAIGPETYTFNDLLELIKRILGSNCMIIHVPSQIAIAGTAIISKIIDDVILTPDEVEGLQRNLLASSQPATGNTRLSEWLEDNSDWLGSQYYSEIKKHYK